MRYVKNISCTGLALLCVLLPMFCRAQMIINPSFDSLKTDGIPIGWQLTSAAQAQKNIPFHYDSQDKIHGYYSLQIRNDSAATWLYQSTSNKGLDATRIMLSAWVKVTAGDTGTVKLFVRLAGIDSVIAYQETDTGGISANQGWTRLWLTLPFDKEH